MLLRALTSESDAEIAGNSHFRLGHMSSTTICGGGSYALIANKGHMSLFMGGHQAVAIPTDNAVKSHV